MTQRRVAWLGALALLASSGAGASPIVLYHVFALSPAVPIESFSIPLAAAGEWHIGNEAGPLASDGSVEAVLSNLGRLEIGGFCANNQRNDGCGFVLTNPDLAGLVSDDLTGNDANEWQHGARLDHSVAGSSDLEPLGNNFGGSPGGAVWLYQTTPPPDPHFVSFDAPDRFLGDQSAAAGLDLSFRWGVPPRFCGGVCPPDPTYDLEHNEVILTAVPEPTALALLLLGLACLRARGRMRRAGAVPACSGIE